MPASRSLRAGGSRESSASSTTSSSVSQSSSSFTVFRGSLERAADRRHSQDPWCCSNPSCTPYRQDEPQGLEGADAGPEALHLAWVHHAQELLRLQRAVPHHKSILLSLLASPEVEDRQLAVNTIFTIREQGPRTWNTPSGQRPFQVTRRIRNPPNFSFRYLNWMMSKHYFFDKIYY